MADISIAARGTHGNKSNSKRQPFMECPARSDGRAFMKGWRLGGSRHIVAAAQHPYNMLGANYMGNG